VHKYQASGTVKNNKQQNRNIEHKFREKSAAVGSISSSCLPEPKFNKIYIIK
jgi:hypothetical protein